MMLTSIVEEVDDKDGQQDADLKARPPRAARPLVRRLAPILALAAIFFGVLLVRTWGADSSDTPSQPASGTPLAMPRSPAIEQQYGVRFTGVDVTSGGGMIQLRYQVLDSGKTEAIHDETVAPYVIDSKGTKYADPGLVGHSHVGPVAAAGSSDSVLLANAQGGVKAGSIVTIKIGDLELRNVPVD
jgi:hypothetical protein